MGCLEDEKEEEDEGWGIWYNRVTHKGGNMKYLLLAFIALAAILSHANPIVGSENVTITQGVNCLKINWRPMIRMPNKLQSVLKFLPTDNVIGDKIELEIEGKRLSYVVEKWDAEASTYTLKMDGSAECVTFASLPYVSEVYVNHQNSKQLKAELSGYISGQHLKNFQKTEKERSEYYKRMRENRERNRKAMEARRRGVK